MSRSIKKSDIYQVKKTFKINYNNSESEFSDCNSDDNVLVHFSNIEIKEEKKILKKRKKTTKK